MEVIAGVSSILQVIDSVTRVAKRLNEVRESYNNVALNTTLVASQLSTIRAALEALYEWRASDQDSTGPSKQLDKDLGMSLSCCAILISVIDGKLDDSGYMPGLKQKIKYLWLEDILKEYISNLEGQVRALQLLLTIFQCRTATEKRQKLANEESRTIIEQVRAETASLALENVDFQDAASVLSLNPSVTLDIDSLLMKSPAYKRVYGDAPLRMRMSPVVSPSPVENSDQAISPVPTPFLNETLQPRILPSQPTRKSMPQSQGRINVWDYYPCEKEEEYTVDATIMADSSDVFELPEEMQGRSAASQPNRESKKEPDIPMQCEETATQRVDEEVKISDVESLMDSVSEMKPLPMQTERVVPIRLPAAVDEEEPVSVLEGFMNQLDLAFEEKSSSQDGERGLGLLYGTAAAVETEEGHMVVVTGDEASPAVSRKGSKELAHRSEPQSEDLGPDLSGKKSLREEVQRPMSTHSSLYECSIIAMPKEQNTRTSLLCTFVSCRNVGATDHTSENDRLEAEIHDLVRSSSQPETESIGVQQPAIDTGWTKSKVPNQSQQSPVSADPDTSNESHFEPPPDVLPPFPKSTNNVQHKHDDHLPTYPTASVDNLAKSDSEELERIEMSQSSAGTSMRHLKTQEMSDPNPLVTKELPSTMLPHPRLVAPIKLSYSQSRLAHVFAPSRNPESEQSTLFSNRGSSAHDATSTVSSEAPEDSTILSLQESTSNITANSISTHAPGLDLGQAQSDLRRLQNELATAKVRGDSRAVQDSLQRSIEVIRRTYLTGSPADDNSAPTKPPSPRLSKMRSNFIRFPSLPGSTKGVALGDFAATGNTISVQNILREKVNIDSRSDNFKTPLMRAAMNGHVECMKLLKQTGADEIAVDAKGRTVLHLAVASSRLAAVKWLLEIYPPPRLDLLRHRPSILFRATDVVKGIRSQKNLRETSDAEGSKPLHIAAEMDRGGMVKTLIAAGVDIESKDNWGRTPFHRAIISKHRDSFDTLLRNGAKIAAVDANSASSLHLAAQAGQVDMIVTLLANGAKRWDFDANGNQPVHSAVWGGNPLAIEALVLERTDLDKRTRSGETLLHLACLGKSLELAKYLLTKLVDVNPWAAPSPGVLRVLSHTRIKGSSMTPLHYACCTHDFETAVLLLDHEALVNAPTPEGATALMMAVGTEDTNLANLLLQRGAKVNAKIPGSLITALHLAARRGDLETVQQLCRHRADDSARTNSSSYGRSPIDECAKCPDKKKGQAVEAYLRIVLTNRLDNALRANARNYQASHSEPYQPYYNPPRAQIPPLANPVSYAPWARAQHGYSPDQSYIAQQAHAQNSQYYHPDFDVHDDVLPVYQPGPSAPARLANQAPVHREKYA
ncbi:MAG: hypothetical protein Q9175_000176 [Cornicularia normoerica]